jgi:putative FmdB family regulatory protein
MPTYSYECEKCEVEFDELVKLEFYKDPQPCPQCGEMSKRTLGNRFPAMVFRGDSWATKNNRIKGQMRDKNKRLAAKEREQKGDGMIPSLAPNVDGERVDSWSDATKLAKSKGKDTSGYEKYARKEKAGTV